MLRSVLLAGPVLATACLAACGGGNSGSATNGATATTAASPSPHYSTATQRGLSIEGKPVSAAASPAFGGRRTVFVVSFVAREPTGVIGKVRRSYDVAVKGPTKFACIIETDTLVQDARPGRPVRAVLDPAENKGGRWCRGRFDGRITLITGYACPDRGVCHVPSGFPRRHRHVGRFSLAVR